MISCSFLMTASWVISVSLSNILGFSTRAPVHGLPSLAVLIRLILRLGLGLGPPLLFLVPLIFLLLLFTGSLFQEFFPQTHARIIVRRALRGLVARVVPVGVIAVLVVSKGLLGRLGGCLPRL